MRIRGRKREKEHDRGGYTQEKNEVMRLSRKMKHGEVRYENGMSGLARLPNIIPLYTIIT
jgi:hypothetical protein